MNRKQSKLMLEWRAGDLLSDRDGVLDHERHRVGVGTYSLADESPLAMSTAHTMGTFVRPIFLQTR